MTKLWEGLIEPVAPSPAAALKSAAAMTGKPSSSFDAEGETEEKWSPLLPEAGSCADGTVQLTFKMQPAGVVDESPSACQQVHELQTEAVLRQM